MALLEVVQAGQGATITLSPLVLTLLGMVVTVAVGWGMIKANIRQVTEELGRVRHDLRNFQQTQQTMMVEALERVARIEGKLNV